MYRARESRTGNLVWAKDAVSYRDYACPNCNASVFVRKGDNRAAHFAHRSSAALQSCYLYHPTDGLLAPVAPEPPSGRRDVQEAIKPLVLSLVVFPARPGAKALPTWGLELTVPKAPSSRGEIILDCGPDMPVRIPMSKLATGPQSYVAHPDAEFYRVSWANREVNDEYAERVKTPLPGLDPTRVAVFDLSSGTQKRRALFLTRGETYYFIYKASSAVDLPAAIQSFALMPSYGWKCVLVTLPAEQDERLEEWLTEATGLQMKGERRRWGVLYPPLAGIDEFGDLIVPKVGDVVLGFHTGQTDQPASVLRARSAQGPTDLTFAPSSWRFVSVVPDKQESRTDLSWDGRPLQGIVFRDQKGRVSPEARLTIESGGSAVSVSLHAARASELLADVREGNALVVGIHLGRGIRGAFRWRAAAELDWSEVTLLSASELETAEPTAILGQVALVNEKLRDPQADVHVDCAVFGEWLSLGQEPIPAPEIAHASPKTRSRVLWLLAASGIPTRMWHEEAPVDGKELLDALLAAKIPPHLSAHRRALSKMMREERHE